MKYKYLLFDLDDTLINDNENKKYAFQKILEMKNLNYSFDKYQKWLQNDVQLLS